MKQNHQQVASNSSRHSAAPQPKTAHSRAGARPTSASPCIALFPEGDGDDVGTSAEIIDLSKAEYAALKRAAAPCDGILMFMAKAALEKAGWPGGAGHQPAAAGNIPSGFCLFNASVGELAGEIPLVGRELSSVVIAACRTGITVDQFISDAIREKLGREPGASTSNPMQASGKSTPKTAQPVAQRRAA